MSLTNMTTKEIYEFLLDHPDWSPRLKFRDRDDRISVLGFYGPNGTFVELRMMKQALR